MTDQWTQVSPWFEEPSEMKVGRVWTPKVGDRVRVRLSGECLATAEPDSVATRMGEPRWHRDAPSDGFTGEVVEIDSVPFLAMQGHRYHVMWDRCYWWKGPGSILEECTVTGDEYAAIELDPLDWEGWS